MVQLGANRYGKAEVRVVHVARGVPLGGGALGDIVTDRNVSSSLSGDVAGCYLTGDNANVLATDTTAEAEAQFQAIRRKRAVLLYGRRGGDSNQVSDEYADYLLAAGMAAHVDEMLTFTARGTAGEVRRYLDGFIARTGADELVLAHGAPDTEARLKSVALLAEAMEPALAG